MHFQKYIVLSQVTRYYRPKERRLSPTPLIYHLSEVFQGVMERKKRREKMKRERERSRSLKTDLFAVGAK